MSMPKIIAIITARGGSKRIPRKNIRPFCGKPIIAYAIQAALESNLFSEVMVSTDDQEIASIAQQWGATVPFYRSSKTSDDHATTAEVLLEVLTEYQSRGQQFERGCCIYPTAAFVTGELLQECFSQLQRAGADSLVPILQYSFPPQRAVSICSDERIVFRQPEHRDTRSQDLEPIYHDSGQFYFFTPDPLRNHRCLVTDNTTYKILPETSARDIDTPEDWAIAEALYQRKIATTTPPQPTPTIPKESS